MDVLSQREDGYHDIRSIVQTIGLFDRIHMEDSDELVVDSPGIPLQEDLVYRAARLLQEHGSGTRGARIRLEKVIPMGAGLGGGSSDAAQTLLGLRELWGVPVDDRELAEMASQLGSDVPFLLRGGTALMEGRGEKICPLPALGDVTFLVVMPPVQLSTREVYRNCTPGDGHRTDSFLEATKGAKMLFPGNDLESAARSLAPQLDALMTSLSGREGPRPQMTGSGSAIFLAFSEKQEAQKYAQGLPPGLFRAVAPAVEEMPSRRANANKAGGGSTRAR